MFFSDQGRWLWVMYPPSWNTPWVELQRSFVSKDPAWLFNLHPQNKHGTWKWGPLGKRRFLLKTHHFQGPCWIWGGVWIVFPCNIGFFRDQSRSPIPRHSMYGGGIYQHYFTLQKKIPATCRWKTRTHTNLSIFPLNLYVLGSEPPLFLPK